VFETYRMLGREREQELLAEAERLRPLRERRRAADVRPTLLVIRGLRRHSATRLARHYHLVKEKTVIRFTTTLALIAIAIAVPVAQARPFYGPVDPTMATAIRMHPAVSEQSYGPLDPTIATAIRMHPAVYGPHDLPLSAAIQTPLAAARQPVAVAASSTGFDWGDFGVGAAAMLGLVLALGSLRKGVSTVRSRQSEGLAA
jgi:hypothetical protein